MNRDIVELGCSAPLPVVERTPPMRPANPRQRTLRGPSVMIGEEEGEGGRVLIERLCVLDGVC